MNFDPGFMANRLFKLTYNDQIVTPDGKHLIPDHVTAMNQPSCSFSFVSSTITNTASFSESLSVDASVNGEGWGASFSASVGYKNVHETTSSSENRFYSTKAVCMVYSAAVDYDNAMLSDDFELAVKNLGISNSTDTTSQYRNFIDEFGTHFVYSMRMGGRYGYQSQISNSKTMELASQGLNVKAAAGYSGLVTVNANAATDEQMKQAKEFEEARSSVVEFFVGGGPPSGNDSWTPESWAVTVEQNPLPITYTLVHIENLFTKEYFPNDENISVKKDLLTKALLTYCLEKSAEPDLCYKEYQDSSSISIKLLAKEDIRNGYGGFWVPFFEPFESIPGHVVGPNPSNVPSLFVIIARDLKKISHLIRPAETHWNISQTCPFPGFVDFRTPTCPDGFSSISDFYVDMENGFDGAKSFLPCFAESCLADCSFGPPSSIDVDCEILHYEQGYPALFGNYKEALYSFFRNTNDGNFVPKCLTYACLDF